MASRFDFYSFSGYEFLISTIRTGWSKISKSAGFRPTSRNILHIAHPANVLACCLRRKLTWFWNRNGLCPALFLCHCLYPLVTESNTSHHVTDNPFDSPNWVWHILLSDSDTKDHLTPKTVLCFLFSLSVLEKMCVCVCVCVWDTKMLSQYSVFHIHCQKWFSEVINKTLLEYVLQENSI